MGIAESAGQFASWLVDQVIDDATGRVTNQLDVAPSGRFWLGTLVSEEAQIRMDMGQRGERLDPCAIGVRYQPSDSTPWQLDVVARFAVWRRGEAKWEKLGPIEVTGTILASDGATHMSGELHRALRSLAATDELTAEIRTDVIPGLDSASVEITLVNTSPEKVRGFDTHLFEASLSVRPSDFTPYVLASLPDSFRYHRNVPAYGINVGIEVGDGWFNTIDAPRAEQLRPLFWNAPTAQPDISFATLADDPLPSLRRLVAAFEAWGSANWSDEALRERAANRAWTDEMLDAARTARAEYEEERDRLEAGLTALESNSNLLRAFRLMNEAMIHSSRGRYPGWRPFQLGFILSVCRSIADPAAHARTADIVWFATGGGKTETYLGLVMMAALFDRLTGKTTGVTAWSRFPLRLLSLQQTQRFADAMAGAELVRRRQKVGGEPFSLGFLIGRSSTPNRIEEDPDPDSGKPDPEDEEMPGRYRVLLDCPFCFSADGSSLEMAFDHEQWTLQHHCVNPSCDWPEESLPFFIVDDEIYRFLPTVVVGTLDKIASLSIQASMAGLFGPPRGLCNEPGHGHVYARRSSRPQGCLVPSCDRPIRSLPMSRERYAPTFRLQDELHLLRDALGAVDAHYEALVDHLQRETTGTAAKILASSATLSGFEHQVDVLYRRQGRVFPVQGPSASSGFWTAASETVARHHIALAPRGSTLEFANDRINAVLQQTIRRLRDDPEVICAAAGVPRDHAEELLSLYGTNVVYGNTIRDLDAAARSLETQVPVDGPLNTATLTGQTPFDDVRSTLDRLQHHEPGFDDRLHVITASSMMSHGVDIDRLNSMVVLGLPLTTAEYIQTTARVGRTWPGIVFVLHKMARERDASTFRAWEQFIVQGDRFVEPVPITKRSVRVLERTAAGLLLARLLHVHEPKSATALTTIRNLRRFHAGGGIDAMSEIAAIESMLDLDDELDGPIRKEIESWIQHYFDNLDEPPASARFPSDIAPGGRGPMLSLRDVEETAPVRDILR